MRILIISSEFPPHTGGIATLAFEEANGLNYLGNIVQVEALGYGPKVSSESSVQLSIHHHEVRWRAIARLAPLTSIVMRAVRTFKPDFILCTGYRGFGLPVYLASKLFRIPFGLYLHGTELKTEHGSPLRNCILNQVMNSGVLFSNSWNTRKIAHSLFPSLRNEILPVTPGVNFKKYSSPEVEARAKQIRQSWQTHFKPSAGCKTESDALYLVSLCRMTRGKGIHLVIEALAGIRKSDLAARVLYVAAGEGPDLNSFRQLAEQLGVEDNIFFTGNVNHSETADFLKAGDVYIQPSQPHGDYLESFGISFLEAQAAGLPCIGSDWGGVSEAVRPGTTSILVPLGDVVAIQEAIIRLCEDKVLRQNMSEAGTEWAAQNTWDLHCRKLNHAINSAGHL